MFFEHSCTCAAIKHQLLYRGAISYFKKAHSEISYLTKARVGGPVGGSVWGAEADCAAIRHFML